MIFILFCTRMAGRVASARVLLTWASIKGQWWWGRRTTAPLQPRPEPWSGCSPRGTARAAWWTDTSRLSNSVGTCRRAREGSVWGVNNSADGLDSWVEGAVQSRYLHTGRGTDVPQVLAGAVNAEILILPQARIPLLSLAFRLLSSLSPPPLSFWAFRLQDGGRVVGFAGHGNWKPRSRAKENYSSLSFTKKHIKRNRSCAEKLEKGKNGGSECLTSWQFHFVVSRQAVLILVFVVVLIFVHLVLALLSVLHCCRASALLLCPPVFGRVHKADDGRVPLPVALIPVNCGTAGQSGRHWRREGEFVKKKCAREFGLMRPLTE